MLRGVAAGSSAASVASLITTPCTTANAVLYNASTPCSANLTYNGTVLATNGLTVTNAPTFSALTSGRIPFAGTAGLLGDASTLTYVAATGLTADGFITTGTYRAGATGGTMQFSTTAGAGPTIAAGTATTDVAALSVTRTNNNAAVATGVKIAFTDTTSAAGFEAFGVYGGTAGTSRLFNVSKGGFLGFGTAAGTSSYISAGAFNGEIGFGGGTTNATQTMYLDPNENILRIRAATAIGWSSTSDPTVADDTVISRISAGVTGFGLTAAGQVTGQAHAAALQASLGTALTLTAGAIGMSKMTASGSAPGASGLKLEVVCGTNAGSAKITALAGTSTTPVTVLDNIGSGVSGC